MRYAQIPARAPDTPLQFVWQRLKSLSPLTAFLSIALAAALVALFYTALPAAAQISPPPPAVTDYDSDDDGLIEIANLDQLNAVRWDPDGNGNPYAANAADYDAAFPDRNPYPAGRMGCIAIACFGYELAADLDFDTDNDNSVTSADAYPDWTPLPAYSAVFNGNGHTVNRLTISGARTHAGLFAVLNSNGFIRNLGIINPDISSSSTHASVGAIAGRSYGVITASYASGGSISLNAARSRAGGLVGLNNGRIRAAWSSSPVDSGAHPIANVGGLAGFNGGFITAAYSIGTVAASSTSDDRNGYTTNIGGLTGYYSSYGLVTDSYCDLAAASTTYCTGFYQLSLTRPAAIRQTTTPLQSPTGYAGIYANWNVDIDGDSRPDDPWDFGGTTTYPALKFAGQNSTDYDADGNRLIEINTLAQLNAVRWDLDGDGFPESSTHRQSYIAAFPGADFTSGGRMGCPSGNCVGYELTADLDFDTDNDNDVDSNDDYPNWTPIGGNLIPGRTSFYDAYSAVFEGNGHTITRLTINNAADGRYGLFGRTSASAVIRNLGIIDANVTAGYEFGGAGILVGDNRGAIIASYVQGGAITAAADTVSIGGLAGSSHLGLIAASYSTAAVSDGGRQFMSIGGLVGANLDSTIIASYAAGRITAGSAALSPGVLVSGHERSRSVIIDSHCDRAVVGASPRISTSTPCIGFYSSGATTTGVVATTTAALQSPVGYTGIYANWNIDLDGDGVGDNPWRFGGTTTYPTPRYALPAEYIPPPPATSTQTRGPATPPGNGGQPATSTDPGNGQRPATSTDPGSGQRPATSTDPGNGGQRPATSTDPGNGGQRPATTTPPGGRQGSATTTDPGSGNIRPPDTTPPPGDGGDVAPPPLPGAIGSAPAEEPYNPDTAHPEIYANAGYGMSATCQTHRGGATITFDLGRYPRHIILTLSLWNGQAFQSYEAQDIAQPPLIRTGQTAQVQITTNPSQTRFRIDGGNPRQNLLLGYADCHTDDQ